MPIALALVAPSVYSNSSNSSDADTFVVSRYVTVAAVNFVEFALQLGLLIGSFVYFMNGGLDKLRGMNQTKLNVVFPKNKKDKEAGDVGEEEDGERDEDCSEDGGEDSDEEGGDEEDGDGDNEEDESDEEFENTTTLADVAGIDEAKREVIEVIDFISNPEVYEKLGAKMPRGVLLSGPPGCGKTLLARAIAGEAGVPMIVASGSDFIEMYVGVGAQRIRQLFSEAKKMAPCIIFIDEIDSIGRKRSGSTSGSASNTEQDQTINRLLTAMDGFVKSTGIVVIAATNRPDMLDEALLRPGRFDRHVTISPPNFSGRTDILVVHTRDKPLDATVNLEGIARMTRGFSGAELENLCNEAAIGAARQRKQSIDLACFEDALDKILLGLKTGASMTEEQRHVVAYHEAGHALMGLLASDYDAVRKVSIIPRGSAGGVTLFEPKEGADMGLYTQQYLENKLIVALGGRVAEEVVFGRMKTTTGAYGDFQQVYQIARSMIAEYGFSQHLGQISWAAGETSSAKAGEIDAEVLFLVDWAHRKATALMTENEGTLHDIAKALLEKGELNEQDLMDIVPVKIEYY